MWTHAGRVRSILLLAVIAVALLTGHRTTTAHPLDQLTQHLFVELGATEARFTVAVGGGILANELVLSHLDTDGDGAITPAEQTAWLERWHHTLGVTLDGEPVAIAASDLSASVPPVEDFHLGVTPILISFTAPLPADGPAAQHLVSVRNEYLIDRTTYRVDVTASAGAELLDQSWPGATIRLAFSADPSVTAGGNATAAEAAREWSGSGVLANARNALEHERTPGFILALLGIFALMGALHAIQPGHGKTLVAAYLVATGGTPRDALTLAGIVTATHTVSVFALGLATLGASELFLPSKVIPVMGALSGLLVAAMGIGMLRGAIRKSSPQAQGPGLFGDGMSPTRDSSTPAAASARNDGVGMTAAFSRNDNAHHHHDHAHLTDEEHARLHLEEALAVKRGVSRRSLIALGVSGGMAPCPDALAILLLAIGMNQAGLGMIAIIAFSFGLAAVLVAFGLAVALARPAWRRAKLPAATGASWFSAAFGRFATAAPLVSAAIVLVLGLAMAWRSVSA